MIRKRTVFIMLAFLFMICGFFLVVLKLNKDQQDLKKLIEAKLETPLSKAEIVERFVSDAGPWSQLQAKVKDTVVQVFSQVGAIDLLQPYKTPGQYQGTGSGFFINKEGELITNAHVVDQAKSVWIQIPSLGKQQIDVDIVGVSPERDIALLKVRPDGMDAIRSVLTEVPYLPLGDSDFVRRADEVMCLGYPLGMQGLKSTVGVVSGREAHLIQIDAPINPGGSGGPSVNHFGQVIGINTLYAPDAQNVGLIIPINELKIVLDDLHNVKLLRKPFLGILYNNASDRLTKYLGNPEPGGLYVVDVYQDSPLCKAGVKKGDQIYEINGHTLDIYGDLSWGEDKLSILDYVSQIKLGQEIHLVVYRQGKRQDVTFTFDQSKLLPVHKIYLGYEPLDYEIVAGMVIQPLTINHLPALINSSPSLAKYTEMKYQMDHALIITHVFPDSQAHRSRALAPGAILKKINGNEVKTMDDLRESLFQGLTNDDLTIETAEGVFVVCSMKKVLHNDQQLARDYFFPLSSTMQTLIAKAGAQLDQSASSQVMLADNLQQKPKLG
jgi:serine protease Do